MAELVQTGHEEPPLPAVSDDLLSFYDRLRAAGPVHRVSLPDGSPVWLVTRYADVRAGLADPRLSLSKAHAREYRGFSLPPALDNNLLNLDPPDHTRIRRLVSQAFTARRVAALRPAVQAVADALIDAFPAGGGPVDVVAGYAGPLPVTMISDLLGVPMEHRSDFRSWSTAILLTEADPRAGAAAVGRLAAYLTELLATQRGDLAAGRSQPADDLLTALISARDGADVLTEDELTSLAFLVLVAGYENSVNLIANGVAWLLERPESLAAARAGEDALAAVVEELLRVDPPAPVAFRRFPTEDITIGGVTVPAGATVLLGIAAANRDPDRPVAGTRHADQRPADSGHLAFGHGIHYCVGAPLARLEAQVAIGTLVRRLPGLALAVPAEQLRWRPSVRTRALIELPVRW